MASLLDEMLNAHQRETRLPSIHDVTRGNVECPICEGWGWVCENHAVRMGLKASGSSHGLAKLTEERVGAIRQEHENGMSKTRLALLTGISWRQIGRIVGRESWPYVA